MINLIVKFEQDANRVSKQLEKAVLLGVRMGFYYSGKLATKYLQDNIKDTTAKTGLLYPYKKKTIRASASGEYVANRSGKLRKSVGFSVDSSEQLRFGVGVEYAKYLAKTRKMVEEPLKENREQIQKIILEQIKKQKDKIKAV